MPHLLNLPKQHLLGPSIKMSETVENIIFKQKQLMNWINLFFMFQNLCFYLHVDIFNSLINLPYVITVHWNGTIEYLYVWLYHKYFKCIFPFSHVRSQLYIDTSLEPNFELIDKFVYLFLWGVEKGFTEASVMLVNLLILSHISCHINLNNYR